MVPLQGPRADQGADREQDHDRRKPESNAINNRLPDAIPGHAVLVSNPRSNNATEQKGDLIRAREGTRCQKEIGQAEEDDRRNTGESRHQRAMAFRIQRSHYDLSLLRPNRWPPG